MSCDLFNSSCYYKNIIEGENVTEFKIKMKEIDYYKEKLFSEAKIV